MESILKNSLSKSYTYSEYRRQITLLLQEGKSSGNEQSEALTHYSELNEVRMNRLDKTMKVSDENGQKLQNLKRNYIWLVISEGWCGDAAQTIPIFHLIEKQFPKIKIKLLLRDENVELMDLFLTNGSRSIPKVLMLDASSLNLLAQWGPRPSEATALINNLKAEKLEMMEIKEKLHAWYAKNKGVAVQSEIIDILATLYN
jgi:integrase